MQNAGFEQSQNDYSLFIKRDKCWITILLVYVDDIVITRNNPHSIKALKEYLHSVIQVKDLGNLKYFLGIEVARSKAGIYLNQRKYTLDLLSDAKITGVKPCDTPMEQHVRLTTAEYDEVTKNSEHLDKLLPDAEKFRRLIGRLVYLTITRPDICYSVQNLSQFMNAPKVSHMESAIRILKYLKSTPGLGILLFSNGPIELNAFCDSDWATCPMTRRSVTRYCIQLGKTHSFPGKQKSRMWCLDHRRKQNIEP